MPSLEQLLHLQDIDTRLDQLAYRRDHLGEIDVAAAARATVDELERAIGSADASLASLEADLDQIEQQVAELTTRRERLSTSLYDGSVSAHKDLEAIQHQIDTLNAQIGDHETAELEVMETQESLQAERSALVGRREQASADLGVAGEALADAQRAIDDEVATINVERDGISGQFDESLLAQYDGLRRALGGIAVAKLDGRRCDGCHMQLAATDAAAAMSAPADELVPCANCGRLLVR